ncbi:hypothetical protein HHK36_022364 [Tetracentron sinense]|uniref:Uncharacterized protein n=1 Tax=Tetracentron sinense TaxID=13715 RepID=A0A834YMV7_TETSI|nr:hypothetical protein HHK36_022364 [Tetracentron sinense]
MWGVIARRLSPGTNYGAYFVFKFAKKTSGHDQNSMKFDIGLNESRANGNSFLDPQGKLREEHRNSQEGDLERWLQRERELPRTRADGWLELEMIEFFNNNQGDVKLDSHISDIRSHRKSGLIIQGIEVRPIENFLS